MKELKNDIKNIKELHSSDIDEYSFTVSHKKISTNVIVKLDINSDDVSNELITNELIKYINTFENMLR